MGRKPPHDVEISLYAKSGRRCARCNRDLFEITADTETNVSEMAHIVAFSDKGPRGDANMDNAARNREENYVLLCASCHKVVDKQPEIYTVEALQKLKKEHEAKVLKKLDENSLKVDFAELDNLLKYLVSDQITINDEYRVKAPLKKIQKNKLSKQVSQAIFRGMIGIDQVRKYIKKHPDVEFGNRVRETFVLKYRELYSTGVLADKLFYNLWDFASLHSNDPKVTAAGLSVLVYLFEACEVFEK